MSKLVDNIRAYQTGVRGVRPEPLDFVQVEDSYTRISAWGTTVYSIHTTIGADVEIRDNLGHYASGEDIELVKTAVARQVAEEIFGEYRKPLLELYKRALVHGDRSSGDIVNQIMDSMFKV